MPYYVRILSPKADCVRLQALQVSLSDAASDVILKIEAGTDTAWESLLVVGRDGDELAVLEGNPVRNGELGAEELEEFKEEVRGLKPASGSDWLSGYLQTVQYLYSLQVLDFDFAGPAGDDFQSVIDALWSEVGGIIQSDGEGFTNEQGYTIVWQFARNDPGPWNFAVRKEGEWVSFQMDMGNKADCDSFKRGEVPKGARLIGS